MQAGPNLLPWPVKTGSSVSPSLSFSPLHGHSYQEGWVSQLVWACWRRRTGTPFPAVSLPEPAFPSSHSSYGKRRKEEDGTFYAKHLPADILETCTGGGGGNLPTTHLPSQWKKKEGLGTGWDACLYSDSPYPPCPLHGGDIYR